MYEICSDCLGVVWVGSGKPKTYWQRGLELFLIGLVTNVPPGEVTRQAITPSHQNRRKSQAVFSNGSYTYVTVLYTLWMAHVLHVSIVTRLKNL
jgi:hypothetical protein